MGYWRPTSPVLIPGQKMLSRLSQIPLPRPNGRPLFYKDWFDPEVSQAEQFLADTLQRHSRAGAVQQAEIPTPPATFYVDVACVVAEGDIGVECDGAPFHTDSIREICRDALILETGRIKSMYHIRSDYVRDRLADWLHFLSLVERSLFTDEMRETIKELVRAYDGLKGTEFKQRWFGFLTWRHIHCDEIRRALWIRRQYPTASFSSFIERVRDDDAARH